MAVDVDLTDGDIALVPTKPDAHGFCGFHRVKMSEMTPVEKEWFERSRPIFARLNEHREYDQKIRKEIKDAMRKLGEELIWK